MSIQKPCKIWGFPNMGGTQQKSGRNGLDIYLYYYLVLKPMGISNEIVPCIEIHWNLHICWSPWDSFWWPFFWPSESVRDGSEAVGPNLVDLLELSEHVRKQTHNVLPMKWQYAMLYFQVHTKESGSGAQGLPVNSNHHVLAELFEVAKGLVSSHPNNWRQLVPVYWVCLKKGHFLPSRWQWENWKTVIEHQNFGGTDFQTSW
jgi:hypothetical protein